MQNLGWNTTEKKQKIEEKKKNIIHSFTWSDDFMSMASHLGSIGV